jgi:putative transposase
VSVQCQVLEVSRSGFYAWQQRPQSDRSQRQEQLVRQMRGIHAEWRKDSYGSPRMYQELKARGHEVSENTVARLMKEHGLRATTVRKFRHTTDSNHAYPVAQNVLDREFAATRPNEKWVSDITYVWTDEGWLYLAAVEDLYSRKVVGWSLGERMTSELTNSALKMAIDRRLPSADLMAHSDRGSQYASGSYQELLKSQGITCSMSRRGNCWDNAPMESFFATFKKELVYQERYATRAEARQSVFEYIEVFYNSERRHSSLGYVSPQAFEEAVQCAPSGLTNKGNVRSMPSSAPSIGRHLR